MPQLLDGNRTRDEILAECRPRIDAFRGAHNRAPGLAVVLAGNNSASEVYVRNKTKTADSLGMHGETILRPSTIATEELLTLVHRLNADPAVDGILVQLPLPPQVDSRRILLAVAPEKDVDGFHPVNVGLLCIGRPGLRPCTPSGIVEMLLRNQIPIAGRHAVVVGRSDIVGKPMAMLLLHENATVTICHSRTQDLAAITQTADILVAAIGRTAVITEEHIRAGAVVIDVGMNTVTDRAEAERLFAPERLAIFDRRGSLLTGDVHPQHMVRLASAYTPVPGGVGPLTIGLLMRNTIDAAERRMANQ